MELLKVNGLKKVFPKNKIAAIDGVDFCVFKGEVLGLVGESGCGKTTLAKAILRLTNVQEGSIHYKGRDLLKMPNKEMMRVRKEMQVVFQDPYMSLDPRIRIGDTLEEVFIVHHDISQKTRKNRVIELLEMVGLGESYIKRLPSELSGGERQRVGIARALATSPEFIICDEPVSSLDISVQAQILNLLLDLQKQKDLTFLFISHDLRVISSICDRVIVMKSGRFVEDGQCREIFNNPKDSYTQNLVEAVK